MSLEINYIDAPDGAQDKMKPVGEDRNAFSKDSLIRKGARNVPYATLEPGQWKLDGTRKILPDEPKATDTGWWNEDRSVKTGTLGETLLGEFYLGDEDDDCRFENPPVIEISFPVKYSTTGFTFTFSPSTNQWISELKATYYSGEVLLFTKTYYPDGPRWELDEVIDSFDRVVFELLATNEPGQFAKIQRIEIGRNVLFGADEIVSARLVSEVDQTLCSLPVDTIIFEMRDPKNRGFAPQENQKIELLKDGETQAVQYITASTRKSKTDYTIKSQSCIGLLNDDFLGGIYVEKPVEELLTEILGEWEYDLASVFAGKKVNGYIPVCTQREALQMVSFSIGAMITTQSNSKIRLLPVPTAVSGRFTDEEIIVGGSVKTASRYAKIEIYSHAYVKSDISETLMNEEEVDGKNVLITFSMPHYDYEITGGTLTGFGDNWVTVTADGPVTLTAKTYTHNTRSHVKRNPAATVKEKGNSLSVKGATLINTGNVSEALDRLYLAAQRRQTVRQPVIIRDQQAGQIVSSKTPWGTITQGFISAMDSKMTQNGNIADIQIQGIEISLESVWFYSGEIYSGGQEVVY